jgi:methylmalonyl-CoA mutase N-terminal domain/subunit
VRHLHGKPRSPRGTPRAAARAKRAALRAERERWEAETLRPFTAKSPERADEFMTTSSVPVKRLYTADDLGPFDEVEDLGFPGEFPFTRGVYPTMYRGRLWTMRQFSGFGTAAETNARLKYLLAHGQTGLSIAFDLPTLYGYDTDDAWAAGEFGKCGVGVSSLKDMETLFEGIPVGDVTTSMTINSPASTVWAYYIVNGLKRGVPQERMGGTIQNDILKEYIAQKEFLFPPRPSMRLVVDTFEYAIEHMPRWYPISVSGYHIREAGSTAVQELAFTLADGFAYLDAGIERGLKVDDLAPKLSFFWNVHNDLFEEVAKFRVARRIFARVMRDRYGAKNPRSWVLKTHAQTAGCSLSAQQAEINVARVTIQALAAVLGGTQSLHTNSLDEALALPSDKAVRIALRTQQIIAHESGVASTIDPLAGSYFLESLMQQMEEEAMAYFDRIEALGGVIPAIEKNFFQREIADAAYRYQREIDEKKRIIVGVNDFTIEEDLSPPLLEMDPQGEAKQVAALGRLRKERDNKRAEAALRRLHKAAEGEENTMPFIIECAKAYTTLQEVTDVFREVFGEYRERSVY